MGSRRRTLRDQVRVPLEILPAFRIQRPRRFERDGFSVDVSAETIVLKTGFTETPEGELHAKTQKIARSVLLAFGSLRKQRTILEFDHTQYQRESPSDGQLAMVDEVAASISYVKLDGMIVEQFFEEDFAAVIDMSAQITRSDSLKKILEWKVEFYDDPERKLAPLYNIIELARREAGQGGDLCVSRNSLKRIIGIMNDETIRTSRHPGQGKGQLRDISQEELAWCQTVVDKIIETFVKRQRETASMCPSAYSKTLNVYEIHVPLI